MNKICEEDKKKKIERMKKNCEEEAKKKWRWIIEKFLCFNVFIHIYTKKIIIHYLYKYKI